MTEYKKLLVIDDEENMRHFLKALLEKEGYAVCLACDGQEGLDQLDGGGFGAVLCDLRMPGMDGMEFLRRVSDRADTPVVITMSAYGTIDMAVTTMQLGAYDYISKPFKPAEIILTLKKAEERERLRTENMLLRREVEQQFGFDNIIGKSTLMQDVFGMIRKIAAFKSAVLITGESGTGKELVSRAIHYNSPRAAETFLAINCGAIPETLLESELFGHKRGAFTGATHDRKGFFEEADRGTLFLDEIGEVSSGLQVKLLRALQESEIRRVGEERSIPVDVRVIAATSRDLLSDVEQGRFREDLFYRLNVLPVALPPLRDRREDIPLLVEHFIKKYNGVHGLSMKGLAPAALRILMEHAWPGNIRELENIVERCMVLSDKPVIDAGCLPDTLRQTPSSGMPPEEDCLSVKKMTRRLEDRLIRSALEKTGGNKSRAAKLLELSYPALLAKIDDYGIGV